VPKKNDRSGKRQDSGIWEFITTAKKKRVEYNLITMHKQIRTENKYNLDRHAEKLQISENWHSTLCNGKFRRVS
jgi:hypothetical protein